MQSGKISFWHQIQVPNSNIGMYVCACICSRGKAGPRPNSTTHLLIYLTTLVGVVWVCVHTIDWRSSQCSRLKALVWVSFWRALRFQRFSWRAGSNPRRWSKKYRNEIRNSYWTCAWVIWYMFSVRCEELKNQPSNSTSCSDNALRSLVLVVGRLYWGL